MRTEGRALTQSLVVVSGLSGSGKSIALKVLEDAGYYCVDNLPATLLLEVADFLALEAHHERIAVSVDARSASLPALPENIERLKARGFDCRVIYLEANTPTLLRRFSETRRRHPVSGDMTLSEAIERERTLLAGVAPLGQRIDTSELQPRVLQNWIRDLLGLGAGALTLLFESFSYKQGVPLDADWVLDARMIANPHYDPKLRPHTGRDAPVIEYLEHDALAQQWLTDVRALLARWLPEIVRENRSHVTVAIGCTGGRHRSVYLAERLAESFRAEWKVLVRHRGLSQTENSA
ncbi:MAG TPA: RNase adapter RapZ [Burkholderiales bacterium]|nr:RNase adapter RapZ [Burkholderiales bacterium]